MVGGCLDRWFREKTDHLILRRDINKNYNDDFSTIDICFICIDIQNGKTEQRLENLKDCVDYAKQFTKNVFIRSTVAPGTNDLLGTTSCPEFLTARRSYEDMCKLPIIVGETDVALEWIFRHKKIIRMKNTEAELAKLTHNCFGAMKVNYFNLINRLCRLHKIDYQTVLNAASITGYIEKEHTQVPGHDGLYGFGGTCFPQNVITFKNYLKKHELGEASFFELIDYFNKNYREEVVK